MSRADELRAELALAEAEERLVKAKSAAKPDPKKVRTLKDEVRAARAASRAAREATPQEG